MLWDWANDRSHVYILDLDGTLMPSAEIDNQCFWEAVFSCYGDRDSLPDLNGFRHVTDSGILNEWCAVELGREPLTGEVQKIKNRFLQLLESAASRHPSNFKPLPGASEWLDVVATQDQVYAGIATGGWEHSARFKMNASGLARFGLPIASSDDAVARADIMRIAASITFDKPLDSDVQVTYVGDGVWDFEASQQLGWGFIGIADGERARQLEQAGASQVHASFR